MRMRKVRQQIANALISAMPWIFFVQILLFGLTIENLIGGPTEGTGFGILVCSVWFAVIWIINPNKNEHKEGSMY
ncbi:MAG TPA: hypothetical protein PKC38_00565 [Chitinophagales bacterium]|nr:hypothetical protein [Chitinophagales bacterium]